MFNLIMKGLWTKGRDSFPLGRMFEYTSDEIEEAHQTLKKPDLDKILRYPCLFMEEGMDEEQAFVGHITSARIVGSDVKFEYTLDPEVPPLTNAEIYANRADFDMPHDFEFHRNHWALKDVDLYRLLLRQKQPRRQHPRVFSITEHEKIEPKLVSAMMPFDAGFSSVHMALKEAVEEVGMRLRRADDIWENPSIIQDVVSLIDRSRVVICDCTGRNPNVFYEAGIAHTLGREVILITQSGADIPFDLRHLRYIPYHNNGEGRNKLKDDLVKRLTTLIDFE
ncbi:hypothetical protein ASF56_23140 [Methylobacterium sp. Leaf122]|nr:hypothetical protein [Methylobacterium sp. Leaf122]KQQ17619.1 hypothetical protein ASF56_23140 [Methylobacterium sp. Leaf122]